MSWPHRNALTVRNDPGGPAPASVPPSRLGAVGEALGGIAAELDGLEWDWRERTAEERAMDERRPWYPSRVVNDPAEFPSAEYVGVQGGEFVFTIRERCA